MKEDALSAGTVDLQNATENDFSDDLVMIEREKKYILSLDNSKLLIGRVEELLSKSFYIHKIQPRLIVDEYYDTDDFAFRNRGVSLRLRKENEIYKITLKRAVEENSLAGIRNTIREETEEKIDINAIISVLHKLKEANLINGNFTFTSSKIFEAIFKTYNFNKIFRLTNNRVPFLIAKKNEGAEPFAELSFDFVEYFILENNFPFSEIEIELIKTNHQKEFTEFIHLLELEVGKMLKLSAVTKYERGVSIYQDLKRANENQRNRT